MWRTGPLPILRERVSDKLLHGYRNVREPPAPERPRLGLSEADCQAKARLPRSFLVGACGLGPVWKHRPPPDHVCEGMEQCRRCGLAADAPVHVRALSASLKRFEAVVDERMKDLKFLEINEGET